MYSANMMLFVMQVQREKDNAIKTRSPLFGIGQIRMSCFLVGDARG
jgi:hypothetical protein